MCVCVRDYSVTVENPLGIPYTKPSLGVKVASSCSPTGAKRVRNDGLRASRSLPSIAMGIIWLWLTYKVGPPN